MSAIAERMACFLVERSDAGAITAGPTQVSTDRLGHDGVLIEVAWSSLNYKDALAARGHAGVVRHFPHVPGIDAAGMVCDAAGSDLHVGQRVVVTGNELGAGHWGGWAQYIRVPREWIVELPEPLTLRESMVLGTAGFTAAQGVLHLQRHGVGPSSGLVAVTGATGGVGSLAVRLLAHLGYRVVAFTGKRDEEDWLRALGAVEVRDRRELVDASTRRAGRPLESAQWAGAIDTVGGETLAALLRSTDLHGCVAACGLVGGTELATTVFPFILRGVSLCGVTSQNCRLEERQAIWRRFAAEWRLSGLDALTDEIEWVQLESAVARILAGQIRGRVVVRCGDPPFRE